MRKNLVRTSAFSAVRMAHRWPWRPGGGGLAVAAVGAELAHLGLDQAVYAVPGGLTVTGAVTGWWWLRHVAAPHTTKAAVARRAYLSERAGGTAGRLDVMEHAGPGVLLREAGVLRPSLRDLSARDRRRLDPREVGVEVARLGWRLPRNKRLPGTSVWSSCEDVTLRIAPPRCGKTTALSCHGLDAPGALLTTSTRLDLAGDVHTIRSERGPVWFFDPVGIIDPAKGTPVKWRVLSGCSDFTVACRRASAMIPPDVTRSGVDNDWHLRAQLLLGMLLHAAAIGGRDMNAVRRWSDGEHPRRASEPPGIFEEVRDVIMARGDAGASSKVDEWRNYCKTNDRTRTSTSSTMAAAVAWVSDDRARAIGDPRPDDPNRLDIRKLVTQGETLHLVGDGDVDTGSRFAPLVGALTAEVAHVARRVATESGGRLDPPLTMILDEAGIITKLPLDRWTADMGGRGITLHISVQSFAQLRQTWGPDGSEALRGNVATLLIYGGSNSADDLRDVSDLIGHRLAQVDADDRRMVPVIPPSEIHNLGKWEAVVLRRGMRVFVGRTPSILERRPGDRLGWVLDRLKIDQRALGFAPKPVPLELTTPAPKILDDEAKIETGELEAMLGGDAPVTRGATEDRDTEPVT
ncbi:type IV secretory system conjugative DNA transfer family protein, partial [Mycolicibacterium sp.]|uniref:type IV secretory system conjugative DNA transfer family protein n=1 Tax=Mycolicibacterium sp. TaxID=2320850 RepID=UPI00355ECBCB